MSKNKKKEVATVYKGNSELYHLPMMLNTVVKEVREAATVEDLKGPIIALARCLSRFINLTALLTGEAIELEGDEAPTAAQQRAGF